MISIAWFVDTNFSPSFSTASNIVGAVPSFSVNAFIAHSTEKLYTPVGRSKKKKKKAALCCWKPKLGIYCRYSTANIDFAARLHLPATVHWRTHLAGLDRRAARGSEA